MLMAAAFAFKFGVTILNFDWISFFPPFDPFSATFSPQLPIFFLLSFSFSLPFVLCACFPLVSVVVGLGWVLLDGTMTDHGPKSTVQ